MTKRFKKTLSFLLAMTFVLALMPTFVWAAEYKYQFKIGGLVFEANKDYDYSSEGWIWDSDSQLLTLDDYDWGPIWFSFRDATILLADGSDNYVDSSIIGGGITITGAGNLTVRNVNDKSTIYTNDGDLVIDTTGVVDVGEGGLVSTGKLIIKGDSVVNVSDPNYVWVTFHAGIYAAEEIDICDNSKLQSDWGIRAPKVSISDNVNFMLEDHGIRTNNLVLKNKAKVTINRDKVTGYDSAYSYYSPTESIQLSNSAALTINDYEDGEAIKYSKIKLSNSSKITINNCMAGVNFSSDNEEGYITLNSKAKFTIKNCSFGLGLYGKLNVNGASQLSISANSIPMYFASKDSQLILNGSYGNIVELTQTGDEEPISAIMTYADDKASDINPDDYIVIKNSEYIVTGDPLTKYVKYEITPTPTPPDEEPGGEEPGTTPGGEEPGGEEPGTTPSGETPNGTTPGGENPSGTTPGGEIPSGKPSSDPTTEPTPSETPDLDVGDFVDRCYDVALGREADEAGYDSWKSQLNNGQACGAQVGYGFIFSPEYILKDTSNEQFVKDLYTMFFDREPDEGGFNYWVGMLNDGTAGREQVFAGFANSVEFFNLCSKYGVVAGYYVVGVNNEQQGGVNSFVARLYKVCLNRMPDQGGQAGWVIKLMNGEVTGTSCAYGFVFSPEFVGKEPTNVEFVNYMYAAFFGREADEEGLNYWVSQLDGGTASREDIFSGFAGSIEFANLCAGYGINA